jgi:predicted amidohydrolase
MNIQCFQIDSAVSENPKNRMDRVLTSVEQVADAIDLVILPEHWISGAFNFQHQPSEMAQLYENFLVQAQAIADKKDLVIHTGSGLLGNKLGQYHNSSFLLTPGERPQISYSKLHPFSKEFGGIVRGNDVLKLNILGSSVSPLICYDLRFPESFRNHQNFGAEIFIVVAAWPISRINTWSHLLKTRAIENQAYVVGVNGVGMQDQEELGGCSAVFSVTGDLVASAGYEQQILGVTLDLKVLRTHRSTHSYLKDARLLSQQYASDVESGPK